MSEEVLQVPEPEQVTEQVEESDEKVKDPEEVQEQEAVEAVPTEAAVVPDSFVNEPEVIDTGATGVFGAGGTLDES